MVCFLADANRFILIWKGTLRGACVHAKSIQLSPTLCDPADCSQPGSSIHGILQARILEWVVISFSKESSQPRDQTSISCIGRWQSWNVALITLGGSDVQRIFFFFFSLGKMFLTPLESFLLENSGCLGSNFLLH